jgi:biotin carboxyl carrier protein
MHSRRLFAHVHGRTLSVDLHPDGRVTVAHVNDPGAAVQEFTAQYQGHGRVRLTEDDRRMLAWAVDAGEVRWVFLDGEVFRVEVDDRPVRRVTRGGRGTAESLAAPMPATVIRLLVSAGQAVKKGETLLLLEAMKMELPLRAPHDAIVKAVRCAEGDLVQPGAALVDLQGA